MSALRELVEAFVVAHRVFHDPRVEGDLGAAELAGRLRGVGLPVQAYALCEATEAEKLPYPFLAQTPKGWRLYLPPGCDLYVPQEGLWPEGEALEPGTLLVAEPPLGRSFCPVEAEKISAADEEPDVFLFYAATSDPEALGREQLFPELEAQLERARQAGREVVFLDAVGLIPEETVKAYGGDEQEAFQRALEAIRRDTEGIERGVPIYDATSPLWQALYCFLAERRVRCVLEELEYDLWKRIVEFDRQKLELQALNELLTGYPEPAARTMLEYIKGFHELNCLERDERFAHQIEGLLLRDGRRPLLWIGREIGHYGVLEALLARRGLRLRVKILGSPHARFVDLLKAPALEVLLFNLGGKLSDYEQELLALRHCLKALLFKHIQLRDKGLRALVEFFSKAQLEELDLDEVRKLIDEIHDPLWARLGHPLDERVYYILKDRGLIPDDDDERTERV